MNTKNLVMASAAFLFAIGSAVALAFSSQDVWVKARQVQNGPITCVNTAQKCESTGAAVCQVTVTENGTTRTVTTSGPYRTYQSDCETLLHTSTGDVVHPSSLSVFQLIQEP